MECCGGVHFPRSGLAETKPSAAAPALDDAAAGQVAISLCDGDLIDVQLPRQFTDGRQAHAFFQDVAADEIDDVLANLHKPSALVVLQELDRQPLRGNRARTFVGPSLFQFDAFLPAHIVSLFVLLAIYADAALQSGNPSRCIAGFCVAGQPNLCLA